MLTIFDDLIAIDLEDIALIVRNNFRAQASIAYKSRPDVTAIDDKIAVKIIEALKAKARTKEAQHELGIIRNAFENIMRSG